MGRDTERNVMRGISGPAWKLGYGAGRSSVGVFPVHGILAWQEDLWTWSSLFGCENTFDIQYFSIASSTASPSSRLPMSLF